MTTVLSPTYFSVRQAFFRLIPPLIILGLLTGGWHLFAPKTAGSFADVIFSIGAFAFYALATGGIAIGYLAWWFSLHLKGMMGTPKHPWQLFIRNDVLVIITNCVETHVHLKVIKSFKLLIDDNWDKMKGMEDYTLIVRLGRFTRILIPGSSQNFNDALEFIRSVRNVEVELVE